MNDWLEKNKSKGINFESNFENLSEYEVKMLLKSLSELTLRLVKNIGNLSETHLQMMERVVLLSENQNTLNSYMESSASLLQSLTNSKNMILEIQDMQSEEINKIKKHLNI